MDKLDHVEKLLAESNKDSVTLIGDGLTKQHFIELDAFTNAKGKLYEAQVKSSWDDSSKNSALNSEETSIFSTEINEKFIFGVRSRLASIFESGIERSYMTDKPEQIKEDLLNRGFELYRQSLKHFEEEHYEKALLILEKAFTFTSQDVNFYMLKTDCFIQLCDFKSAILTINKLISTLLINFNESNPNYNEIQNNLYDKIAFCYYMIGQTSCDSKLFMEALESFNKASEVRPNNLAFKIKSISCLFSMNRLPEALSLMEKLIDENDSYRNNGALYVLRAKLNLKDNHVSKCFHDLKTSLKIDPNNAEAKVLMTQLQDTAEQLRNGGLILSLNNRTTDALNKMTGAISFNPTKPEYHLQRGILYKRLKDFNSAIDDFLIGLEKMNEYEIKDQVLYSNFQRQILLTYNDFAIQCYEKRFYDDAIVLLNKAIKIEKKEVGFYVNRGDCFYKKNEKNFALLDYEQAFEIDPNDQDIKGRIASIYYELAIQKYDDKEYEEATKNFDKAIDMCPNKCKYYISRARTKYFMDDTQGSQKDICISILLEPTNPEIPNIISRIFVNQDLNEVLLSREMQEAKDFLKKLNIKNPFELNEQASKNMDKHQFIRLNPLQPKIEDVLKEEEENLKIIDQKRQINKMIKETVKINFDPNVPRLKPIQSTFNRKKVDTKNGYNWRKFDVGIS
ncbi:unnamed protein product [Brachionus calyciflorus]|uniref:Uncharacterized protein n=1 Tax=Brachionus calyciflorus TaxID=104777 RepID=A0A813MFG7_9BILA|nr:unnamed protein product [Brachionus calyciflorus]